LEEDRAKDIQENKKRKKFVKAEEKELENYENCE